MNIKLKADWHSADIISALHKRGTSMAALSRKAGLSSSTLANVLYRPWPKGEWIIAHALGVHPKRIWPSRYFDAETLLPIERTTRRPLPKKLQQPLPKRVPQPLVRKERAGVKNPG
ncbi:transcriptional regulator [Chimaeribacter arupi]|uniref:Transcriptional regulator n=2 Tax=Yersiniaceae TaxID=1903411 RepID=A0A2N5EJT8_9GAMM|nr:MULTISPECIES: helix-turn-helix transcriptional regulator [Yersiniaceae]MBS0969196.1 helix-turn-helix domain-containing protein [Nissabacter archeti]PLR34905.1 transcriptional regulator [Chimaeribacter arupi]PLR45823.1 transcriptional regulator [Chimaeribacter arupi]PLR46203.1 transcriptional regulator [Chimaeribacter arupi]PLR52945.1 transcriptional regulator [Chimaeribacter arupi]